MARDSTHDNSAWELLVIGGGSAGLIAARTARLLGARVMLVERGRLGGECLWTGCVPSKSMIASARIAAFSGAGAPSGGAARAGVFEAIDRAESRIAPTDSADSLAALGVSVMSGAAQFIGPNAVVVGGEEVRFQRAILAVGSHPATFFVPGLPEGEALTSDTLWQLPELPSSMLVIGGGPMGCELAQALSRLGVDVTLIQRGSEILPGEHPKARSLVLRALEADGVRVMTGRTLARVERGETGTSSAVLDDETSVPFERVLFAGGRVPILDSLDLRAAGIGQDDDGWVSTDRALRTTNPAVWAAGDVTSTSKHTHTAGVSGAIAARNALLGSKKPGPATGEPRVIFTDPEVASVGESSALAGAPGLRVITVQHRHLDRAITDEDTSGFTQLVVDRRGRLRGGTIVGPRAGESIGEVVLAVSARLTVSDIAAATHPYPTYNDGIWNAAILESQRRIREGVTGRAAQLLRRARSIGFRRAERRTASAGDVR